MARYTGPITKKSRRLKVDLVGGDKNFERPSRSRPASTAVAGSRRSEYLHADAEKQKARFIYGVLEKQFRRYYAEAASRPGKTGENLLQILESRLDNVVYRAGFAKPATCRPPAGAPRPHPGQRPQVDIPSYRVSAERHRRGARQVGSRRSPIELRAPDRRRAHGAGVAQVIPGTLRVLVHQLPRARRSTPSLTEQLIVELYSKQAATSTRSRPSRTAGRLAHEG